MDMIVKNYKDKYELFNSPLYLNSLLKFSSDKFYQKTSEPMQYARYLEELTKKVGITSIINAVNKHKELLVNKTVCVGVTGSYPLYMYTQDKIVICIPDISERDIIKQILGSIFFLKIGNVDKKTLRKFIVALSIIYTRCILRAQTRAIDEQEVTPQTTKYLIGWLLKVINQFNIRTYNSLCVSASLPFTNTKEVNDYVDKIQELSTVSDFLNLISEVVKADPNQIKVSLVMKQCLDFLLGLEDVAHGAFIVPMAHYFMFPQNMYYSIKPLKNEILTSFYRSVGTLFAS